MVDNRTLLSQEEIDALVSFLKRKEKIGNDVLDQSSIDRLVEILKVSQYLLPNFLHIQGQVHALHQYTLQFHLFFDILQQYVELVLFYLMLLVHKFL